VAVVHGGAIVWEEAFGWADQQRRIAATPATPYYLASVTKAFTGTALALLAGEGRIDMNRSVNAYLDSHKVRPALWDESAITVQRVADHIAGLTSFNLDCDSVGPCRLDTVIDRFGVIVRPPGENFDYSNLGYGILGEVIARTSKQSYGEFLRRAVFEPLGMPDCQVAANGPPRRAAVRYVVGTTRAVTTPYSATPAASGAFCSAHSLALFGRALLNPRPGGSPDAGGRRWAALLPSSGVPAVQTGTPSGTTYSRGWWIDRIMWACVRTSRWAEHRTRPRSFASFRPNSLRWSCSQTAPRITGVSPIRSWTSSFRRFVNAGRTGRHRPQSRDSVGPSHRSLWARGWERLTRIGESGR
jgi:CubicO group peptidase (beta-lactamase class C family)